MLGALQVPHMADDSKEHTKTKEPLGDLTQVCQVC